MQRFGLSKHKKKRQHRMESISTAGNRYLYLERKGEANLDHPYSQ